MRKFLVIAALLSLTACESPQEAIDSADKICKDNVEYLTYSKMSSNGSVSYSIVPHFKPDGTLFTCGNYSTPADAVSEEYTVTTTDENAE